MSLRRQLAAHGFESNDDYDFALRCLFEADLAHLRVLHIDGQAGRRKTAFATALGRALDYPHVLYHDASLAEPPPPPVTVTLDDGSAVTQEPPMGGLDRVLTEACAYSEGQRTLLVLDQLQAAPFADHIRLWTFVNTGEWSSPQGSAVANPRHLLLALISEQPLYHSLAKAAFRIWTDAERAYMDFRPQDFGLDEDADLLLASLGAVFAGLGSSPTPTEFARLLDDLLQRVRSEAQLRQAIFGRVEGVDRDRLHADALDPPLRATIDALAAYVGAHPITF